MKQTIRDSTILRGVATLAAATGCLVLGSCVSTTITPPPAGSAVIDAVPDPKHRDRVEGIALVAINGRSVKGTRCVIESGLNTIKTRFRWPQGQDQQVQLRFYATPDTIYFIYYDVYPPSTELTNTAAGRVMGSLGEMGGEGAIFGTLLLGAPAAVVATGERLGHGITQHRKPATHIDLVVVAHHSSQGTVRQVRAYPDGRVDEKPWAAWAQMQAP